CGEPADRPSPEGDPGQEAGGEGPTGLGGRPRRGGPEQKGEHREAADEERKADEVDPGLRRRVQEEVESREDEEERGQDRGRRVSTDEALHTGQVDLHRGSPREGGL